MRRARQKRTKAEISAIMRKVRSKGTTPEQKLRKALRQEGLQFRTCVEDLPGKPDIVIPSKRVALFVDGDFWHGGQWKRRSLATVDDQFRKTRSKSYWVEKIRRNIRRDCAATAALLADNWTVLRFWESSIQKDLEGCVAMTLRIAKEGASPNSYAAVPLKTFSEFFAGIGLMRAGLEKQGWSVTFANDIEPLKHEMYRAHFSNGDEHFHLGDVHELRPDKVPSATLATASFPCNDLSLAGAREGLRGKQSSAFWGFIGVLEGMKSRRPPIVLVENVPGFLTSHQGRDFTEALLALNKLGYAVDTFILDAVCFVPQSRQRLFVIGVQQPQPKSESSGVPALVESQIRPKALAQFMFSHPEINWCIRSLPAPPVRTTMLTDILEDLKEDAPEWWSRERTKYLLAQMSPRHRRTAQQMIDGRRWSYGTVFRRVRNGKSMAELRTDDIAGCLRTPRGGSGRQILLKAGKGKYFVRLLTPRECARLMGADDFKIDVTLNQALFGFGDAVCVPVVEWIAKFYLNPLVNELIRDRSLILPAMAVGA